MRLTPCYFDDDKRGPEGPRVRQPGSVGLPAAGGASASVGDSSGIGGGAPRFAIGPASIGIVGRPASFGIGGGAPRLGIAGPASIGMVGRPASFATARIAGGGPDGRTRLGIDGGPASPGIVGGPKLGIGGGPAPVIVGGPKLGTAGGRIDGRAALVTCIALPTGIAGAPPPRDASRFAGMIVRGATDVAESGSSVATSLGR